LLQRKGQTGGGPRRRRPVKPEKRGGSLSGSEANLPRSGERWRRLVRGGHANPPNGAENHATGGRSRDTSCRGRKQPPRVLREAESTGAPRCHLYRVK